MKRLFFGVFGSFCLVLLVIGMINYMHISSLHTMQGEVMRSDQLLRSFRQHKELFMAYKQHGKQYDEAAFNLQLCRARNEHFWQQLEHKMSLFNHTLNTNGYTDPVLHTSDQEFEQLRRSELLLLHQIAGLGFKELGTIGSMREHAHYIERAYPQHTTRLLSLRRHEKDFLMRIRRKYVDSFRTEYTNWKATGNYPKELDAYATDFFNVSQSYFHLMNTDFPALEKDYETVQTNLHNRQSRLISIGILQAHQARQTVLLLNGCMIVFAIVASFLFIARFGKQVRTLQRTMAEYISTNYQLREDIHLKVPKNDLGRITLHFLKITRKIRNDMHLLEERVERRTVTLQKKNIQLELQHREIMDSLRYAQNLQQSLLVSRTKLLRSFREAWVYYQPRDLVGGDFYWMKEMRSENGTIVLFALADCTGHGVPGALLSVMGMNALDELIESGTTEPAVLLNQLRSLVVRRLNTHEDKRYDGMDMALFAWDTSNHILSFSGAQLPIWILRRGEIIMEKGQRLPIGYSYTQSTVFTEAQIQLMPGDRILLFSDGLVDQFGGTAGKKMGKKFLHDWLCNQANESTASIHHKLSDLYQSWKGTDQQTDDCTYVLLEPEVTGISEASMLSSEGTKAASNRNENAAVSIGWVNKCG